MLETISSARKEYLRHKKARALMLQRTQLNAKSYVYRGGYNTLTASYTGAIELGRLSGSSLNRQHAEKQKLERTRMGEIFKAAKAKGCKSADEFEDIQNDVDDLLRNGEIDKLTVAGNDAAHEAGRVLRNNNAGKPIERRMSIRTKGKVRDKATALHRVLTTEKTFMTLTFITGVEDKKAVLILNNFLTTLRLENKKKKIHYLWVAEKQENGNIHFHMVLNKRIKIFRMNALWVLCQYNAGLRFQDVGYEEIKSRYEISMKNNTGRKFTGSIEEILNPLDVEKIKSIYGLNYYLTKYITMNKSKGVDCAAWHCSRVVSKLFTKTVVHRSTFSAAMSIKNIRVDQTTGECKVYKESRGAFHHCVFVQNRDYFLPMLNEMEQVNRWILDGMNISDLPMIDDEGLRKHFMDAAIKN